MKIKTMNKPGEKIAMPQWADKKNRIKFKNKLCVICGKEFFGHAVRKYCDFHLSEKNADRVKLRNEYRLRILGRHENANQENTFNNKEVLKVRISCGLEKCGKIFETLIFPKQAVIPKFCEDHRSEFRRKNFLRINHAA
jgi:hypothetical protein